MKRLAIIGGGFALVAAALLVLSACAGDYTTYTPSAYDLTRLATGMPEGPAKATAEAVALERFATAQAAESQLQLMEATRQVIEITQQAYNQQAQQQYVMLTAAAQATEEGHRRAIEQQHVWATQQAANATEVAQATAQAVAMAATAQAMAIEATATERAYQATATQQALDQAATATAQYRADVATATAAAGAARTTATAESRQATQQAYAATATRAAEKREVVLGYGRDYGLPLVLLLALGGLVALVIYGIRQHAKRPIVYKRSLLGDAEPMVFRNGDGSWTLVDLDRQPGHVTRLLADGTAEAPQFRSAGQEERTTARDQAVDAVTRPKVGGGQRTQQAPRLPAPPVAPAPGLRSVRVLRRLDQAGKAGLLPPALVASLEADWEEEA